MEPALRSRIIIIIRRRSFHWTPIHKYVVIVIHNIFGGCTSFDGWRRFFFVYSVQFKSAESFAFVYFLFYRDAKNTS